MSLYKVVPGSNPRTSDVNQVIETLLGEASVGTLSLAGIVAPPNAAPTLTATAGAGLSVGTYQYVYTLVVGVRKSDGELLVAGETTASPIGSVTTTVANGRVTVVTPTSGFGVTVIGKRIYRTVVNGAALKLVATIPTNQASFVDAVADGSLGAAPPSVNDTATKLRLGRDPVDDDEAVTKRYADNAYFPKGGGTVTGDFTVAGNLTGKSITNSSGYFTLKPYNDTYGTGYSRVDAYWNGKVGEERIQVNARDADNNGISFDLYIGSGKVWTSANDGAGSGLDADKLDNMEPTSAATGNTIMQRDSDGRAKVAAPSAADDIARKDTVDALKTTANAWTQRQTFQGGVIDGNADTDVSRIQSLQHNVHKRSTVLTYTSGQLTKVEEKSGANVVKTTTLNYTDGRLTSVVETADGVTITTTLNYDGSGVLTSTTRV